MASEPFIRKDKGSAIPGHVTIGGQFTTTTSGTIGSSATYGGAIAKTAAKTGRYTITLPRASVKCLGLHATVVGPDDAALTTTKGLVAVLRDDDIATDGTIEVQFVETVTANADTELQDAAKVYWVMDLIDTDIGA